MKTYNSTTLAYNVLTGFYTTPFAVDNACEYISKEPACVSVTIPAVSHDGERVFLDICKGEEWGFYARINKDVAQHEHDGAHAWIEARVNK